MPHRRSVARLERIALMGIGDAFAEAASGVDDDNGELSTTAAGKRLQEMLLESIPHYFHKEILSECLVSACAILVIILGGAATCSEGFVICFLKVPLACLGSMAAAV